MSKVLELKNLSYIYGTGTPFEKTAVNNLSLSIEKGEFIGIMGHTGSGKSTLVQMLNGLMKPTSGQVLLDGEDIWANPKDIRKIRFKVGMVFQYPEYQLFEETVAKDIAFGPMNMGKSGAELEKAVNDAARFTGLKDELLEKSPFDLSGGEKRRAAIAGVIAMNPEVLVLDEPTAGLDPMGRDVLLSQIVQYHKERKNTVILVSHSMEDIARYADRIMVEQVLINLLKNAIEACEESLSPQIVVEAVQKAGMVIISVIDNGSGIVPEAIDKVFVPFFTTKSKGSGIGLSLCRQIMNRHGGSISLDSQVEKGSSFVLHFPIVTKRIL